MHEQPILYKYGALKAGKGEEEKNKAKPYVISAYFEYKYHHTSYDGSSDSVPTNEIERCGKSELEEKLMKIAEEDPQRIEYGIELKLLPAAEMFLQD